MATWRSRTLRCLLAAGKAEPRLPSARTRPAQTPPLASANATAVVAPDAASAVTTGPDTCTSGASVAGAEKPAGGAAPATEAAASAAVAAASAASTNERRGVVIRSSNAAHPPGVAPGVVNP